MRSGGVEGVGDLRWDMVEHTRGAGIELGHGPVKLFPHFIGVRLKSDPEKGEHADYVCDDWTDLGFIKDGALDFIVQHNEVYVPEHEQLRVLKNGGVLAAICDGELILLEKGNEGFHDLIKPGPAFGTKTVCIVRYGAIGDTLQAASILPELKRQGYHVTWLCEPSGYEYMKADPRIDAFLVNDKDQVPNHELTAYWAHLAKKFDRFINLCESVEGSLVKLPGRADFNWPDSLRREMCNHNYLEFIAKMAELPFHPEHHFYETDEESAWADDYLYAITREANKDTQLGSIGVKPYVVMCALAGSSVHKFYPHLDSVLARILLEIPEAHVILVGDAACVLLECGWEKEPRIHRESGRMPIRNTLALAKKCQLVIGPETGVLNAVAFESNAKVILLSHSSIENLTKHWVNTVSIEPTATPCYPCHRMHYTRAHCPEDKETGASKCMAELPPDRVWQAVHDAHNGYRFVKKLMETA